MLPIKPAVFGNVLCLKAVVWFCKHCLVQAASNDVIQKSFALMVKTTFPFPASLMVNGGQMSRRVTSLQDHSRKIREE
jgi:hypothetical protein